MTIYGRSEELVSRCVECDLAEPESLASLGGSAPELVDGILSCSIKQGHKGRLKAFLLTVSNLSQLLQRSALTNYCIDLLATKLFTTSPGKLTSATYPIYHQKMSTVSCQITLNSLQTLICIVRDTCC